jgi:hypothetical protein
MKGATPDDEAKMSNNPKSNNTLTIGISHHNFRAHRNWMTSPTTPVFVIIPLIKVPITLCSFHSKSLDIYV